MQNPFLFNVPEIQFTPILPVVIVAVTGILALIGELLWPKRNNDLIVTLTLTGLGIAGLMAFLAVDGLTYETAANAVYHDDLGAITQLVIVIGTLLTVLFSEPYLRAKKIPFAEFYPLVLWSATGAMIMCMSRNLLVIFLGLEILSVALYVMAGMARGEERSGESALKYFLLGAFASGFFLYGVAFLYGASGSLDLADLTVSIVRPDSPKVIVLFGLGLILIGLGFKSSLVPFHQWTPDVYQGAPTNVSAFMATVSKVGAFVVLLRVVESVGGFYSAWIPAMNLIAILTMTVGNVMALGQKNVKRILGYSSIAQAGYVLVAILAHATDPGRIGTGTLSFFLFAYTLTTIGVFAVVSLAAQDGTESNDLSSLNGMMQRAPIAAVTLLVFCMSLIGIPLTAGFTGKLQIFMDAMSAKLAPLAIVLAVNSVISAWYYLGIARAALTPAVPSVEGGRAPQMNPAVAGACVLCLAGVLAGFFLPPLLGFFGR
jgi:NADH-quinone oxidoreductase subunit N